MGCTQDSAWSTRNGPRATSSGGGPRTPAGAPGTSPGLSQATGNGPGTQPGGGNGPSPVSSRRQLPAGCFCVHPTKEITFEKTFHQVGWLL